MGLAARVAFLLLGAGGWMAVGRYCGLLDRVPTVSGGLLGYPLMSLGGAAIFLSVLGAAQDGLPFLKYSGLIYLGKISYGLYAFHILGWQLSGYLFGRSPSSHAWSSTSPFALALT